MREWINIVENLNKQRLEAYLKGNFYHGSARRNHAFHDEFVAYFTQSIQVASDYAMMDAEIDGGIPVLFKARLSCVNPAIIDTMLMQDLMQTEEGRATCAELTAQGYDCAVSSEGTDEIAVFGNSNIQVVEVIPL